MVCGVHDTRADGSGITLAYEPRGIGLHHHVFLGHSLIFENGIIHFAIVSQSDEAPGSDTLGQRET